MGLCMMTRLLEQALEMVSRLPEAEHEAIAAQWLADLRADERWDEKFAATQDRLAMLASRTLAEHRAGLTRPLNDDSDLTHD